LFAFVIAACVIGLGGPNARRLEILQSCKPEFLRGFVGFIFANGLDQTAASRD
jgi:hypothetical protein